MDGNDHFFYANAVELSLSPYDMTLRFLRNMPPPVSPDQKPAQMIHAPVTALSRAADLPVMMSPQQGKALIRLLLRAVLEYEKVNGKLSIPPENLTLLKGAINDASNLWK